MTITVREIVKNIKMVTIVYYTTGKKSNCNLLMNNLQLSGVLPPILILAGSHSLIRTLLQLS
jgi:hypothetical protein